MRVTPDRLDVAEAALEAYAEHLMQYGRAALPPRNDLRRVIEALPERSDAMSDPIKDYARAVAGAVRDHCANRYCVELGSVPNTDLDAIIATVPAPVMQHHAAPTCDGWWWAGDGVGWRPMYVTLKTDKWHSCYDRWVGPLLPPDTTEPAPYQMPGETLTEALRRQPPPDIDPEEVRRAIDGWSWDGGTIRVLCNAAREWLRLREQPDEPFTWERVARRVGEEFAQHNGPDGYYGFAPAQWQDWMLSRIYALREQPAPDVQGADKLAENSGDVQPAPGGAA